MIGRRYLLRGAIASLVSAACSKKVPATCMDTSGLPAEAVQIRTSLAYVEPSPLEGKRCDNCRQYVTPKEEGSCGTCALLKGPVHPNGYCKVYGAKG
ncbi:MAG TPA: high-potential iron-sulfur protein [Labilithrix sp.]|jgi:hypothetical protein